MRRTLLPRSLLILLVPLALGAALVWYGWDDAPDPGTRIRLATTTSTDNSGLLGWLLPVFERESGLRVETLAVGTGRALALGASGDADIVLVHARAREDAFVAEGHGIDRRDVMWNDFVLLGPPSDPAGIRGGRDVVVALTAIHSHGATFISRGDDSGTHIRERSLWKLAGLEPNRNDAYLEAGQGMGGCLTIADQKQAYILADRGTHLATQDTRSLQVLVEGDTRLRNPYGAMLVNPQRHPHANTAGATKLLDWLTSKEGQARIGAFRIGGSILFHPVQEP